MNLRKVPVLSLKKYISGSQEEKNQFCKDLFNGFKDYGFVVIEDHTVSESLIKKSYELSKAFFSLTDSYKEQYKIPGAFGQRGYISYRSETAKGFSVADLKEFWHIGRQAKSSQLKKLGYLPNVWPTEVPEFKETFLKIYSELEKTGNLLLEALTYSLEVEKDYFKKSHNMGNSILRLLHYPPVPDFVEPGATRASAHQDIDTLSLLLASKGGGLQLLEKEGTWLPIEADPGRIICNCGDMLDRITGSVLKSTTHRVVIPLEEEFRKASRYSMPFFLHGRGDWKLEKLPKFKDKGEDIPVITADDYLQERLKELGLKK